MPAVYNDLVCSLATCNEDTIIKKIEDIPSLKKASDLRVCDRVNAEIEEYCKKDSQTILRTKGINENDLKAFSFRKLEEELDATTPLFLHILKSACHNPSHFRNKRKTTDAIIPAILSAAAKIISIHTEDMSVYKQLTSLILKKAGLKKMGFRRLTKTYDTIAYETVNGMLDGYAAKFEDTILKLWMFEVEEPDTHHPGYTTANDNVDWEVGPRQMTADNQKKSVHKINVVAYKNRVNSTYLLDDGPHEEIKDVTLQDLLPGVDDNKLLAEHLVVLVGNLWANAIPALSWWKDHLPHAIAHDYEKEMKCKTEKTRLGLYNFD